MEIIKRVEKENVPAVMAAEEMEARLESCDEEPIRIPGSIQRHGFLLILDGSGERVLGASENAEGFLNVPLSLLLGSSAELIFERELLTSLRALSLQKEYTGAVRYLGSFLMRGTLYSVATHRVGERRVLEFEIIDRLIKPETIDSVITNFVGSLAKLGTERELCEAITRQIQDLTGYDRVCIYSFDNTGTGTVLAESNNGALPSFLGLRFPASDIPRQARELYVLNTVRIIPDADYVPSPLRMLPPEPGASAEPLDMSLSLLRSVSPIHLQYMRNMGTQSSMSISVVLDGQLWGLIGCHHHIARNVPYLMRSACDLLSKMVSAQLRGIAATEALERTVQYHAVQRRLLTLMAAGDNFLDTLSPQTDLLCRVTDAEGVALVLDRRVHLGGRTPAEAQVLELVAWLIEEPDLQVFASHHLAADWSGAGALGPVASGLLAIRVSDVRQGYILWFRPELVKTIQWAGQPGEIAAQKTTLSPRASFTAWQETVRGQSDVWSDVQVESARDFRSAAQTITLNRAEREAELNEARFQELTHSLPTLVWATTDEGVLTYVNRQWREQGLHETGVWFQQDRLSAEDKERLGALWRIAVETGTPFEAEVQFARDEHHHERWSLLRSAPIYPTALARTSQDGPPTGRAGWIGTCTDLTDRRERELALKMTEKLALTGRMTSVMAHEINNPLEALTNLLFLLRAEDPGSRNSRTYIAMAEGELQRISGITKQTLRWSRESAQQPERSTAGALFDDVLQLFAGKIRNREVRVTILGGRDVPVFGVLGQLQQVVSNLIGNAVDAVPVGGRVSLDAHREGQVVEIDVTDNGTGIPPGVLATLFQPFQSTKGDLGNGLGLYISQEIMERHGGALVVETIVGTGTTMRMRLPLVD